MLSTTEIRTQVAWMLQTTPGRSGKQHQEQNSPNLGPAFYPTLQSSEKSVIVTNIETTWVCLVSSCNHKSILLLSFSFLHFVSRSKDGKSEGAAKQHAGCFSLLLLKLWIATTGREGQFLNITLHLNQNWVAEIGGKSGGKGLEK